MVAIEIVDMHFVEYTMMSYFPQLVIFCQFRDVIQTDIYSKVVERQFPHFIKKKHFCKNHISCVE